MVYITEELVDLIYIAGIVDGEGYFGIQKRKTKTGFRYDPYFGIRMTDRIPLELIQKYFYANIRPLKMNIEKYKQQYDLRLTWHVCESFIIHILPYLRIKKSQAKIILNFFKDISHLHCKETKCNEIKRREKLYQKMRNINSGKQK